MPVHK